MRFHALAGAALAALLCANSAQALTISSGGVAQALGCSSVSCGATQTLELNPATPLAPATGTIDLDPGLLTLTFDIEIVSLSLTGIGGPDNGVSEVLFLNIDYVGVASLFDLGGGSFIIGPAQTASVSGDQSQDGGATSNPFAAPNARVNGQCLVVGAGLVCGISFGQANFSFDVGSPPDNTRHFQHTTNITALPEPSTFTLMGLALVGGVAATRRR